MVENRYYFLFFILITLIIIITGCSFDRYFQHYSVYGTVTTDRAGLPVSGAEVILRRINSSWSVETETDKKGRYSFSEIREGRYYLRVASSEYRNYEKQYYINRNEKIDIELGEILGRGYVSGYINIYNNTGYVSSLSDDKSFDKQSVGMNTGTDEGYRHNEIIVKYKSSISSQNMNNLEDESRLQMLDQLDLKKGSVIKYKLPQGKSVSEMVDYYNSLEEVEWAEPNYIYHVLAQPDDPGYSVQWGHVAANLEAGWDKNHESIGVTAAVLDTGIIPGHPDLQDNLVRGADFVGGSGSDNPSDYNLTDDDPTDQTPKSRGGSHGTHISGIIGAVGNNSLGIAGVNWNVKIMPIRVMDSDGHGDTFDIAEGIYYAVDHGADVINLSLGGAASSNIYDAVQAAARAGVIMVAASGNNGYNNVLYPAAFAEVIAVGAVDRNHNVAGYSNYGPELDLVAPGGSLLEEKYTQIYSTWGFYNPDEDTVSYDYAYMVGTSMATSYVSGVVCLLLKTGVSPSQIRNRLTSTAVELYDSKAGKGLVDAYGALLDKKLEPPYVFAAKEKKDTLYIKSEVTRINDDSSNFYELKEVADEEVYIYAWRDVNENQIIDGGDYYGKSSSSINLSENISTSVDLDMYYVTTSTTDETRVQGLQEAGFSLEF